MPIRPLGSFADELDMGENTPAGTTVQKTGQAVKSAVATTAKQVKQQLDLGAAASNATSGILDALYGSSTPSDAGDEQSPDNNTGVINHQQQKPQHGTSLPQSSSHANGDQSKQHDVKRRIEELEAEIKKYADEREQRDRQLDQEEEQEKQQMEALKVEEKKEPIAVLMAKKKTETFRGAGG